MTGVKYGTRRNGLRHHDYWPPLSSRPFDTRQFDHTSNSA